MTPAHRETASRTQSGRRFILVSQPVPGKGFEPLKAMPADLQSAPFGRSGNLACAAYPTTNRPYCRKSPGHSSVTDAVSVAVATPTLSAYDVVRDGSRRCVAVRGSARQCVAVRGSARRSLHR